jgi:hypothetical protein
MGAGEFDSLLYCLSFELILMSTNGSDIRQLTFCSFYFIFYVDVLCQVILKLG